MQMRDAPELPGRSAEPMAEPAPAAAPRTDERSDREMDAIAISRGPIRSEISSRLA